MGYYEKPLLCDYVMRYHKPPPQAFLRHYGVKGMKWGVRRTPEELARARNAVENTTEAGIIKATISGHDSAPKTAEPNSIIDHVDKDGKVDVRSFYNEDGVKSKDIHATDHGNSSKHTNPHVHEYAWNEDLSQSTKITRDITDDERKENDDIL